MDEREQSLKAIMDSFETVKKMLKDKAICEEDKIIIFDPPFTLHILKRQECILLYHHDEEIGFLSAQRKEFHDSEAERVIDSWLKALSSSGFRRYRIKRRRKAD
jgi:hypothetical protein